MEEIYFKEDARDKLFVGIQKLHDAVASTMGPNGKTVIIPSKTKYGEYIVTKDGVSVAEQVFLKDPIENIGAQLVKEVAQKTADEAGDGTTTATVLANAFIQNLKTYDSNEINRAFDEIIPKVLEQLKVNSKELKREDIKYVASISANNDIQIGDIIQSAYNHANIVKVEESTNSKDELELISGMKLNVSYFSKHFVNNERGGSCEFTNPFIILIDGKLEDLKAFKTPIEEIAKQGRELVIITEHVSDVVLRRLETNVINEALKLCVIKTPGFGQHRKDLIRDLSVFTDAKVINSFNTNYDTTILGTLKSIKVTKTHSILVKDDSIDVTKYVEDLSKSSDDELTKQRVENLTGKISIIKVGGGSELEMKERFDRYEDAVKAVQCALEEGIVEGGGVALFKSIVGLLKDNECVENKILTSLTNPYIKIFPKELINDVKCLDLGIDMFKQNIIDPLKVTRTALENAVSIAKTILSTDAVVLNKSEWS